eukprot:8704087-Ditylum_brightwellii.AAC.1
MYELYQSYAKQLHETKANTAVIAYLQQAKLQSATALTQQALVEEKPVSSQALGMLIMEKAVETSQQAENKEIEKGHR